METLMDLLRDPRWSPYAVGAGIGVLSWVTFLLSSHPLGVSTAFAKTAGMLEKAVRGPKVEQKAYYRQTPPHIDWEWMLVIGLFFGALAAAWLGDTVAWKWVPEMWATAIGPARLPRLLTAVAGGICLGFGARWGCGCTSGHGISGTLQLVVSSWISAVCFFIGGVGAAFVIYHVI